MHHVVAEPDLADEPDGLGAAVEHGLGADVDDHPAHLGGAQAATQPVGRLEDHHLRLGQLASQPVRGRESRDAATDDGDPERGPDWVVGLLRTGHADRVAQPREPIPRRLRHTRMSTSLRAALAVPVLLLLTVLAAGCGLTGGSTGGSAADRGGSSATEDTGDARKAPDAGAVDSPGAPRRAAGGGDTAAQKATDVTPMARAVISTGQISLRAKSLADARAAVLRLVASWRGSVADEQTHTDDRGRIASSTLTLRVPTAGFAEAMRALEGVGKVEEQSRTSEDVTTQVIDNDARVRAAERSIRQIEALLSRARKLGDLISIESELSRRQADLDSLKSQQAWLEDQTSLSTITVQLSRAGTGPVDHERERGFLAGLDAGWDALRGGTVAVLTALGAVLPFAVLLALVGVPGWLVVRRRVSAGSAPARSA